MNWISTTTITFLGCWVCASAVFSSKLFEYGHEQIRHILKKLPFLKGSDCAGSSSCNNPRALLRKYIQFSSRPGCPKATSGMRYLDPTKKLRNIVTGIVARRMKSLFPLGMKLECMIKHFSNFGAWYKLIDVIQAVVFPCRNRKPTRRECQQSLTFRMPKKYKMDKGEDELPVSEWPCLRQAKTSKEFRKKLHKLYSMINPCTSWLLNKGNLAEDVFYYVAWKLWWYFLSEQVRFILYKKGKEPVEKTIYDGGPIFGENFNTSQPTKVLIHGYINYHGSFFNSEVRRGYESRDQEYNIVVIDWSSMSYEPYFLTRFRLISIVQSTVALLRRLQKNYGVKMKDIHIIGHSLGAHIAGITGHMLNSEDDEGEPKLGRITGLDPALPLFYTTRPPWRISDTSADVVDVIHTSSYGLGIHYRAGTVDFFVNGVTITQPGCGIPGSSYFFMDYDPVCAHYRVVQLFVESITKPHSLLARQCESMDDLENGRCDDNDVAEMGENMPKSAVGSYFLRTKSSPPFGLGEKGIQANQEKGIFHSIFSRLLKKIGA
ncbi:hypothetical protein GE061_014363 [Apolygus lucorum]|uniref:Lipase domain-containing protein n=1 Tax=Apolygus lucorum TaxID=248454 RepID=A0A6A4JSV3_APOLU|nr:hypothetical protein GE061_014363 [Apolygus lucorum]